MTSTRKGLLGAFLALAAVLPSAGCTDLGVGRKCLPTGDVSAVQISTPALECMSRICYLKGNELDPQHPVRSVCTARCTSDDDCKGAQTGQEAGLCNSGDGFVCAVPSSVNLGSGGQNFACAAICICKADLERGTNASSTDGSPCCPDGCEGKCPPTLRKC